MGVHVPRRRCVGCGRLAPKPELVRLASVATTAERPPIAVLDRTGTLPGRGAYVCRSEPAREPSIECMKLATRKGTLQRAFRHTVEVRVELLESNTTVAQLDTSPAGRNGDASRRRVSIGFGRDPQDLIDR